MFDNNYTVMKCYENFIVLTARCGKISLKNKTGLSVHVCMYLPISAQNLYVAGIFDGKPAEMAFMLIFNWLCLVVSLIVDFEE